MAWLTCSQMCSSFCALQLAFACQRGVSMAAQLTWQPGASQLLRFTVSLSTCPSNQECKAANECKGRRMPIPYSMPLTLYRSAMVMRQQGQLKQYERAQQWSISTALITAWNKKKQVPAQIRWFASKWGLRTVQGERHAARVVWTRTYNSLV
eukprot:1136797-Pelagomonas_calceolata.AAC.2